MYFLCTRIYQESYKKKCAFFFLLFNKKRVSLILGNCLGDSRPGRLKSARTLPPDGFTI